jgi:uncharacterized membrane protein
MAPITRLARTLSNIDQRLLDNTGLMRSLILNNNVESLRFSVMKKALTILALAWALSATAASAACVAEYKAKRDNPLKLKYGTVTVAGSNCTAAGVQSAVSAQLAAQGWILLSILSVSQSG